MKDPPVNHVKPTVVVDSLKKLNSSSFEAKYIQTADGIRPIVMA